MEFKEYTDFIDSCRDKNPKLGHNHHITPTCLGGTDENSNLIYLGYKDHQKAHLILADCFPEGSDERKKNMLSAQILNAWLTEKVLAVGWKHSELRKERMSESAKLRNINKTNGFFEKSHNIKTKTRISNSLRGNKSAIKTFGIYLNGELVKDVEGKLAAIDYCKGLKLSIKHLFRLKTTFNGYSVKKCV